MRLRLLRQSQSWAKRSIADPTNAWNSHSVGGTVARDPTGRFNELVKQARQEMSRALSEPSTDTPAAVVDRIRRVRLAEGKVLGYVDALGVTQPKLAQRLAIEAMKLSADIEVACLVIERDNLGASSQ